MHALMRHFPRRPGAPRKLEARMSFENDEELGNGDRPTQEYDLREYAQLHTGPESWTAERVARALDEIEEEPLVRTSDVPQVAITASEVREHALDHREGYVLSLVDGVSTVEALCDITGLPKEETLRVLSELCDRGVITTDDEPIPPAPWHLQIAV